MKPHIQKHSTIEIVTVVGELIANGHGTYRPRLKADDFSDRVVLDGYAYFVKLRWPDDSSTHEVSANIRPLGETEDPDSV